MKCMTNEPMLCFLVNTRTGKSYGVTRLKFTGITPVQGACQCTVITVWNDDKQKEIHHDGYILGGGWRLEWKGIQI